MPGSESPRDHAAGPLEVSVVIPCLDAAGVLGEQLEALAGQTFAGPFEVLIADNGSRDGTLGVVDAFRPRLAARRVDLRSIDASARKGQAFARNAGARQARADRLLFCDADDVVGAGYVRAMTQRLAAEGAALVAPRFDFARLNPAWVVASRENPQGRGLQSYDYPRWLPHAGGSGLGVDRRVHEALGGFDETLLALEDTDYCWRAQRAGFRFVWEGAAVVHVRLRHDLRGLFRQARSYGRHNVLAYRRERLLGMPALPFWGGPLRGIKLLLSVPQLRSRPGRARWISQLGWRVGRWEGSLRYRVWAP